MPSYECWTSIQSRVRRVRFVEWPPSLFKPPVRSKTASTPARCRAGERIKSLTRPSRQSGTFKPVHVLLCQFIFFVTNPASGTREVDHAEPPLVSSPLLRFLRTSCRRSHLNASITSMIASNFEDAPETTALRPGSEFENLRLFGLKGVNYERA